MPRKSIDKIIKRAEKKSHTKARRLVVKAKKTLGKINGTFEAIPVVKKDLRLVARNLDAMEKKSELFPIDTAELIEHANALGELGIKTTKLDKLIAACDAINGAV